MAQRRSCRGCLVPEAHCGLRSEIASLARRRGLVWSITRCRAVRSCGHAGRRESSDSTPAGRQGLRRGALPRALPQAARHSFNRHPSPQRSARHETMASHEIPTTNAPRPQPPRLRAAVASRERFQSSQTTSWLNPSRSEPHDAEGGGPASRPHTRHPAPRSRLVFNGAGRTPFRVQ